MEGRFRILLATIMLAFLSIVVFKPSITGQFFAEETPEQVVVMLKAKAADNAITGAITAESQVESLPVEDIKQAQQEVLNDINNPTFFERLFSLESVDAEVIFLPDHLPAMVLTASSGGIKELQKHELVANVQENIELNLTLSESVPLINAAYAHALEMNGTNITGDNIKVCVLDTGIDAAHEAFGDRVEQKCFCSPNCCSNGQSIGDFAVDDNSVGHGTHVAGVVGANGAVVGVAPGATIRAIKICNANGCKLSDVVAGMNDCIENEGDVLSGSFGDSANHALNSCPTYLDSAINAVVNAGIPVVFAAGNNGVPNTLNYPACSPLAIAAGASTKDDQIASFSNRASGTVLAPGYTITSVQKGGGYRQLSGTSQAAPHVSGVIALLLQVAPNLKPAELKSILQMSGTDVEGFPRVDVKNALSRASVDLGLNKPPVPEISTPTIMGSFRVTLTSSVSDEENILDKNLKWFYNSDLIGTGPTLTRLFDAGNYTIILQATDSEGLVGETTFAFSVQPCIVDLDFDEDNKLTRADVIAYLRSMLIGHSCLSPDVERMCKIYADHNKDGVYSGADIIDVFNSITEGNLLSISGEKC